MDEKNYYPLTSPQLSIWYTEKMYPGTSISNVAGTLRIKGAVDLHLLEKSINLFIKNNEGLRLQMSLDKDGNPRQYLVPYAYEPVQIIDFSVCDDPVKAMQQWDRDETVKPFELLNSALYRFFIIKLSDKDAGFYILTHHIISDAWNMSYLGSSVIDYYCRLMKDPTDETLNRPKPSYISCIDNEKQYFESNRYAKDKAYWDQVFDTLPEMTVLKTKNSLVSSTKSKRKTFIAPRKFTDKLRAFCADNKVSPYPLFIAALAMYINRVTEKEDILIGTPILNRLNPADKNTAGMFVSTIPLRIGVKAEYSFNTFSIMVQELCGSVLRHQRYPYDHILKQVREKHGFKHNLYDLVLSYQNSKFDKSYDVDYITRWHFNEHQSNSFTMHINDRDDEGILIINYDYHADLYYEKEIEFIHQHLLSLLWHALDNPCKSIAKIDMLTENEKRKILFDFNRTEADYNRDITIHRIFEQQAGRTPDNIALQFRDQEMTYKELNEKANRVAWILKAHHVEPDMPVGLVAFRSFEMVIAVLAILKAGGAYLPIDPKAPKERMEYLVRDSKIKILITARKSDIVLDDVLVLNVEDMLKESERKDNLPEISKSRNLIYIIYTSGSTGQPKGVMIEHYSVVNRIHWMQKEYPINSNDTILQKTPYTFDVSVWELFWWFFVGARLALLVPDGEKNPEEILSAITRYHVTTMHFVPSMLKSFMDYLNAKSRWMELRPLKKVFSSGEALPFNVTQEFLKQTGENTDLINLYGPTEAAVDVTHYKCALNKDQKVVPIGKPIDNIKLYILDSNLNIQPINVVGELYIAGDGLARGYINKPELTQERFVENPYQPGTLMYRTGDLARWYPMGDIEYIGRVDHQIKINGQRIELDEIKQQIIKDKTVKDAIVTCKNKGSRKYLCAYVIFHGTGDTESIRNNLKASLPEFMLPSFIMEMEEFPLSNNGKVDFNKLPEPKTSPQICVEPRTELERDLLTLWEEILKVDIASVKTSFFEAGGDSLSAIQLISRLDNVSIEDVYRNPTIEQLAAAIESGPDESDKILLPHKPRAMGSGFALICFPYGGGSGIIYKELFDKLSEWDSQYGLYSVNLPDRDYGKGKGEPLSLEEAAQRITLRLAEMKIREVLLYGHCVGAALTLLTAHKLKAAGIKIKAVCLGGVLPPTLGRYFGKYIYPWAFFTDSFVLKYLRKLGFDPGELESETSSNMIKAFRHDVKGFYHFFHAVKSNKHFIDNIPIYTIIGEKDPLTRRFKNKYAGWLKFSGKVFLRVIPEAAHYFNKTHAHELAGLLSEIKEADENVAG